jgi:hypothetical protein
MGFWGDLAGVGEAIAGAAITAFVPGGAAYGIPLITSGVGTVAQSEASSNAAKAQQAATSTALTGQQQNLAQTKQNEAPYTGLGAAAANNLSTLMGYPAGSTTAGTPGSSPTNLNTSGATLATSGGIQPTSLTTVTAPGVQPTTAGTPQAVAQTQTQSSVVPMKDPRNGRIVSVPANQVAAAKAAGGVVVGA